MKNIELAIQKEQEYIDAVVNMKDGDIRPELLDYISQCGYDSIEEFHQDKKQTHFDSIQFRDWELTSDEITYHLSDICETISSNEENVIFYNIDMNQLSAFVPSNFNKEELMSQLGIQPIYGNYNSDEGKGIIITGDQDFKFAMSCKKEDRPICDMVRDTIIEYLGQYYDDIVYTGNDILIDSKKVAGFASRELGDMVVVMFNLNFHNYMYYIDALCTYEKVPTYIDNKNITARGVLSVIKSVLNIK